MSVVGRVRDGLLVVSKRETCLFRHFSWNKLARFLVLVGWMQHGARVVIWEFILARCML
jgi:hypothetical protein